MTVEIIIKNIIKNKNLCRTFLLLACFFCGQKTAVVYAEVACPLYVTNYSESVLYAQDNDPRNTSLYYHRLLPGDQYELRRLVPGWPECEHHVMLMLDKSMPDYGFLLYHAKQQVVVEEKEKKNGEEKDKTKRRQYYYFANHMKLTEAQYPQQYPHYYYMQPLSGYTPYAMDISDREVNRSELDWLQNRKLSVAPPADYITTKFADVKVEQILPPGKRCAARQYEPDTSLSPHEVADWACDRSVGVNGLSYGIYKISFRYYYGGQAAKETLLRHTAPMIAPFYVLNGYGVRSGKIDTTTTAVLREDTDKEKKPYIVQSFYYIVRPDRQAEDGHIRLQGGYYDKYGHFVRQTQSAEINVVDMASDKVPAALRGEMTQNEVGKVTLRADIDNLATPTTVTDNYVQNSTELSVDMFANGLQQSRLEPIICSNGSTTDINDCLSGRNAGKADEATEYARPDMIERTPPVDKEHPFGGLEKAYRVWLFAHLYDHMLYVDNLTNQSGKIYSNFIPNRAYDPAYAALYNNNVELHYLKGEYYCPFFRGQVNRHYACGNTLNTGVRHEFSGVAYPPALTDSNASGQSEGDFLYGRPNLPVYFSLRPNVTHPNGDVLNVCFAYYNPVQDAVFTRCLSESTSGISRRELRLQPATATTQFAYVDEGSFGLRQEVQSSEDSRQQGEEYDTKELISRSAAFAETYAMLFNRAAFSVLTDQGTCKRMRLSYWEFDSQSDHPDASPTFLGGNFCTVRYPLERYEHELLHEDYTEWRELNIAVDRDDEDEQAMPPNGQTVKQDEDEDEVAENSRAMMLPFGVSPTAGQRSGVWARVTISSKNTLFNPIHINPVTLWKEGAYNNTFGAGMREVNERHIPEYDQKGLVVAAQDYFNDGAKFFAGFPLYDVWLHADKASALPDNVSATIDQHIADRPFWLYKNIADYSPLDEYGPGALQYDHHERARAASPYHRYGYDQYGSDNYTVPVPGHIYVPESQGARLGFHRRFPAQCAVPLIGGHDYDAIAALASSGCVYTAVDTESGTDYDSVIKIPGMREENDHSSDHGYFVASGYFSKFGTRFKSRRCSKGGGCYSTDIAPPTLDVEYSKPVAKSPVTVIVPIDTRGVAQKHEDWISVGRLFDGLKNGAHDRYKISSTDTTGANVTIRVMHEIGPTGGQTGPVSGFVVSTEAGARLPQRISITVESGDHKSVADNVIDVTDHAGSAPPEQHNVGVCVVSHSSADNHTMYAFCGGGFDNVTEAAQTVRGYCTGGYGNDCGDNAELTESVTGAHQVIAVAGCVDTVDRHFSWSATGNSLAKAQQAALAATPGNCTPEHVRLLAAASGDETYYQGGAFNFADLDDVEHITPSCDALSGGLSVHDTTVSGASKNNYLIVHGAGQRILIKNNLPYALNDFSVDSGVPKGDDAWSVENDCKNGTLAAGATCALYYQSLQKNKDDPSIVVAHLRASGVPDTMCHGTGGFEQVAGTVSVNTRITASDTDNPPYCSEIGAWSGDAELTFHQDYRYNTPLQPGQDVFRYGTTGIQTLVVANNSDGNVSNFYLLPAFPGDILANTCPTVGSPAATWTAGSSCTVTYLRSRLGPSGFGVTNAVYDVNNPPGKCINDTTGDLQNVTGIGGNPSTKVALIHVEDACGGTSTEGALSVHAVQEDGAQGAAQTAYVFRVGDEKTLTVHNNTAHVLEHLQVNSGVTGNDSSWQALEDGCAGLDMLPPHGSCDIVYRYQGVTGTVSDIALHVSADIDVAAACGSGDSALHATTEATLSGTPALTIHAGDLNTPPLADHLFTPGEQKTLYILNNSAYPVVDFNFEGDVTGYGLWSKSSDSCSTLSSLAAGGWCSVRYAFASGATENEDIALAVSGVINGLGADGSALPVSAAAHLIGSVAGN